VEVNESDEWISDEPDERPPAGTSMVDLGEPDPLSNVSSDLRLVPEAMESQLSVEDDDLNFMETKGDRRPSTSEMGGSDFDLGKPEDSGVPGFSDVELADEVDLMNPAVPLFESVRRTKPSIWRASPTTKAKPSTWSRPPRWKPPTRTIGRRRIWSIPRSLLPPSSSPKWPRKKKGSPVSSRVATKPTWSKIRSRKRRN
jgi:hypothetical protein